MSDSLHQYLIETYHEIVGEAIGRDASFWDRELDADRADGLAAQLARKLGAPVHRVALHDAPSIQQLAEYLVRFYPLEIQAIFSDQAVSMPANDDAAVDPDALERLEAWMGHRDETPTGLESLGVSRAPEGAIFILCAPRSGSTLLRVMLAGHPRLFAPQELNLLHFERFQEFQKTYTGRYDKLHEGLWMAFRELCHCGLDEARDLLRELAGRDLSIPGFYGELLDLCGDRMLVDKSTGYGLQPVALKRAEAWFKHPKYIVLNRRPEGMIHSFDKARFDRIFFGGAYPESPRRLAEMVWLICCQNIQRFIESVPEGRVCSMRFEDLVAHPRDEMDRVMEFLELDFHPALLSPYDGAAQRMTRGATAAGGMLGDTRFTEHARIRASVTDAWRDAPVSPPLSFMTRRLAETMGYVLGPPVESETAVWPEPLRERNEKQVTFTDWGWVHQFVERQAEKSPDRAAVIIEGETISYEALNRMSNQWAHLLIQNGIAPGMPVGLHLNPGLSLCVGILAVLKAGAVYVPLDPELVRERLTFIVEDVGIKTALGHQAGLDLLDESIEHYRVMEDGGVEDQPMSNPDLALSAESSAYIVYTSGSTGTPKGVLATHGGLANHTLALAGAWGFRPDDIRYQFSSTGPDVLAAELFTIWRVGGALVTGFRHGELSLSGLMDLYSKYRVTIASMTASMWHAWCAVLDQGEVEVPACLRILLVGLEAMRVEALEIWRKRVGDRICLINAYGPSEATITSLAHVVDFDHDYAGLESIPIGYPIWNTAAYVLDESASPVGANHTGELFIGGAGVSPGYLGRPELTAERFLPDRFADELGRRMYRTGDRVRVLENGELVFVGRMDDQVKIRGFRVEPGEIEQCLLAHDDIADAAVIAVTSPVGSVALAAYLVPAPKQTVEPDDIRAYLGDRLPEYMHPRFLNVLDELPKLVGGKVDRRGLPDVRWESSPDESGFVPPSKPEERRLCHLLEELLDVSPVGMSSDFFDLGGDSIIAFRLLNSIERDFGVRLPVHLLFNHRTVRALAEAIAGEMRLEPDPVDWITITRSADGPCVFCLPGVGGNSYAFFELARYLSRPMSMYGFQLPGVDGNREPMDTVPEVAEYFLERLRDLNLQRPFCLAGYSFGGIIAFDIARILLERGEPVKTLFLFDTSSLQRPGFLRSVRLHIQNFLWKPPEGRMAYLRHKTAAFQTFVKNMTRPRRMHGAEGEVRIPTHIRRVEQCMNQARMQYRYEPLPVEIVLFRFAERSFEMNHDETNGWSRFARNGVTVHEIPGRHADLFKEPGIVELSRLFADAVYQHIHE